MRHYHEELPTTRWRRAHLLVHEHYLDRLDHAHIGWRSAKLGDPRELEENQPDWLRPGSVEVT